VILPLRGSLNNGHEHHCLPQFYQLRAVQTRVMFSVFGSGSVRPCLIFRIWLSAVRFEPNFESISTAEGSNGSHGAALGSVGVYLWLLMGRNVGETWQGAMSGVWEHQRQCWDIVDGRRSRSHVPLDQNSKVGFHPDAEGVISDDQTVVPRNRKHRKHPNHRDVPSYLSRHFAHPGLACGTCSRDTPE